MKFAILLTFINTTTSPFLFKHPAPKWESAHHRELLHFLLLDNEAMLSSSQGAYWNPVDSGLLFVTAPSPLESGLSPIQVTQTVGLECPVLYYAASVLDQAHEPQCSVLQKGTPHLAGTMLAWQPKAGVAFLGTSCLFIHHVIHFN